MVIVIIVMYFIKYFYEIVNMNFDIFKYIFICEEIKKSLFIVVEVIEEEMFDYIYE